MDEKYYTTPNGTIVGESTLRSKYGEKFDSFLSDGKITEVAETIYETPNGILVQESVLKDKYGEKFNTFLSDGKLKKKESTEPTQPVQTQQVQEQEVQQAPTRNAPFPGLGGVSERPTPSPSVGIGEGVFPAKSTVQDLKESLQDHLLKAQERAKRQQLEPTSSQNLLRTEAFTPSNEIVEDADYKEWKSNLPENLQQETDGYDLYGAYKAGMEPIEVAPGEYHLSSRDPKTGRILKSEDHDTFYNSVIEDDKLGYVTYKSKDGNIYSKKQYEIDIAGDAQEIFRVDDTGAVVKESVVGEKDPVSDVQRGADKRKLYLEIDTQSLLTLGDNLFDEEYMSSSNVIDKYAPKDVKVREAQGDPTSIRFVDVMKRDQEKEDRYNLALNEAKKSLLQDKLYGLAESGDAYIDIAESDLDKVMQSYLDMSEYTDKKEGPSILYGKRVKKETGNIYEMLLPNHVEGSELKLDETISQWVDSKAEDMELSGEAKRMMKSQIKQNYKERKRLEAAANEVSKETGYNLDEVRGDVDKVVNEINSYENELKSIYTPYDVKAKKAQERMTLEFEQIQDRVINRVSNSQEYKDLLSEYQAKVNSGEITVEGANSAVSQKINIMLSQSPEAVELQRKYQGVLSSYDSELRKRTEDIYSELQSSLDQLKGLSKQDEEYRRKLSDKVRQMYKDEQSEINSDWKKLAFGGLITTEKDTKLGRGIRSGMGDLAASIAGGVEYLVGENTLSEKLASINNQIKSDNPMIDLGEFGFEEFAENPFNEDWWATRVAPSAPLTFSLMAPGIGVGAGTAALATRVGLTGLSRALVTGTVSGIGMRAMESFTEAGLQYYDLIERGESVDYASKQAAKTYSENMDLLALDVAEMTTFFLPASSRIATMAKFVAQVPMNAAEELLQERLPAEELAYNRYLKGELTQKEIAEGVSEYEKVFSGGKFSDIYNFLQTDQGQEVALIGSIYGGAFGGASLPEDISRTNSLRRLNNFLNEEIVRYSSTEVVRNAEGKPLEFGMGGVVAGPAETMQEAKNRRIWQLKSTLDEMQMKGLINEDDTKLGKKQIDFAFGLTDQMPINLPLVSRGQLLQKLTEIEELEQGLEGITNETLIGNQKKKIAKLKNESEEIIGGTAQVYFINNVSVTKEQFAKIASNSKFAEGVINGEIDVTIMNDVDTQKGFAEAIEGYKTDIEPIKEETAPVAETPVEETVSAPTEVAEEAAIVEEKERGFFGKILDKVFKDKKIEEDVQITEEQKEQGIQEIYDKKVKRIEDNIKEYQETGDTILENLYREELEILKSESPRQYLERDLELLKGMPNYYSEKASKKDDVSYNKQLVQGSVDEIYQIEKLLGITATEQEVKERQDIIDSTPTKAELEAQQNTVPVAETPVEETVSAPTEVAEEAAPKELSPKQKEAYNGLTKEEKQAVDELIFDEQYELSIGAKDVEKPKYLTKEESAIWDYEDKIAKESINYEDALNNALGIVSEKQKADGEVFTFGQDKYNIDKAVNLANTEGIEPIEIGIETTPKLRMPFVLKTEEGIENADLSKPVIIATTKDGLMLIDGHHRLEKAIREGKPVKAQILSESQTLKIKQDAVQKQAAGKVPVQPEAKAGEKVEEGKPKAEPKVTTEESVKEEEINFGTAFFQQDQTAEITVGKEKDKWGEAGFFREKVENAGDILRELSSRGKNPDSKYILEKIEKIKEWVAKSKEGFLDIPNDIKTLDEFSKSNLRFTNAIDGWNYAKRFYNDILTKTLNEYKAIDTYTEEQRLARDLVVDLLNNDINGVESKISEIENIANKVKEQGELPIVEKISRGIKQTEPEITTEEGKEVLSEEDAKSEEKVNKKIEEGSGEKDLVKEVVKSTVTKDERKKVAEEEGIDESEVDEKIEEEVKNQINDKSEKEPKTLLQRIASRIRKAIMSLLIVANTLNISGVKAPTTKSKAYDNIKVENLQSFDKMYMDQEAVNKKNNIDIIRKIQANKNENYIIVDKATGSAHLFKGEELITSYQVGVGEKSGDIQTRVKSIYLNDKTGKEVPISVATTEKNGVKYLKPGFSSRTNWNDGTKTTGAGIFKIAEKTSYIGERAFTLLNEQGISTEMMLHEVTTPVRARLMSDGNPDNNRITNGCINFMYEDTKNLEKRGVGADAMVYVLPDNPNNAYKIVDGELRFESEDPKVNRTTAYTKPFQAQPITIKAKGQIPQQAKEFLVTVADVKSEIMEMYPTISNDEYNRMAKIAYGIFGQESSFGTYGGSRGKAGFIKDIGQVALEKVGVDEVNVFGKLFKASDPSVGLTQTRLSSIPENVRKKFGINESKDLLNNEKSAIATMAAMVNMYVNEIEPTGMGGEMENIIPLGWSNDRTSSSPFVKALKGDESQYNNKYVDNVRKASDQLEVYIGDNPIEKPVEKKDSTEGEAPIGLMALPFLFAGTGRKRRRKPLEDTDADKVVTDWMEDVQKIYDAQKTKDKQEAVNEAATNLALSGRLNEIAPDQRLKVLEDIAKQTAAMDEKKSVSITSELEGLTIKEQFKQGFEEYVSAMKQKESDKIQKAKETAQGKIDAVKERTAKAVEKIKAKKEAEKIEYKDKIEKLKKESKADKEARELFEAIVNDIAKDAGLSQISRKKASELLKSSRDVNAENIERLLEKAVRVIEYEYKRNIVKESDKKIKDFKTNIKKNKFGTLTQSAKELAGITTEDIPIGLLPRFVDVIDGVSKKAPSAKDLEELAKFMSEFKNELDQQITDVQYFADVLNDFKTQEETEKIDDYLKDNGFSNAQIEFFEKNRKAINAAYKSFYIKDGKELTAQEKAKKISKQMLEAIEVFKQMEVDGKAKVDMDKFKGKVQQEVNIAEFFNNIKESDIDYLTRTEANKIPVLFDNLNRGMVTNATFKIMNRIKGGRKLDSFEKLDAKSPIKRVKTKDDLFKSFVSNAGEIAKLDRVLDPATLKSSGELTKDIEKKVLDYADEVIKGLKGKPLYEEISKVIRPLVNANTRTARVQEKANELFDKMDGSPLHNTTIMSVYFRSREFDLNPDNAKIRNPLDYINKTLESPNLSEKKRAVLKGIRNEYFRNGKPLTKDMLSFIEKSKGGPLIEFMDEVMSESKDDVRFMSEVIESSPVEFFMGYQPRSTIEGRQSIEDLLSDVSNNVGRPSLKTSAVKSRETGVNALNFDAMDDFMRTAASIDLQRSIAPALSELNAFISEASRSGNADAKIFADTLKKVVESYVKNTLSRDYKQKGIFANIFSSMGRKLKKNTLAGISKATVESIIQLGKIHIDEDASNAFYKNASMKRDVNNQQVLEAFNSIHVARAGVLSSEMSRKRSYITDAVRRGDASKAEELIYSASKTIPGRVVSGVDDFMGDFNTALIKFPDLIGTVQSAIGGAAIRFKEITGKELDFDKLVKDPEYKAKYKDELEASIAYGDQLATRMGGPGSMEQKSLQDIKGGGLWDMNRFVRSFSTNENEQILSALTTLGVPTLSKITGRNKGRQRGAEFENKRKAASGLASSLFGLGAYTAFRTALGTLIIGMFGAMLNGDDWDEEFDDWDWDVFKARVLGDTVWTALFGKLGVIESLVMQSVIAYGVRQSYKANGKEELGDKIADGMFYSTVSQDDKATKEWKMLGPEGKLLGSVLETVYVLADAAENDDFDLLSSPSSKNNIYTIAKGVMNLGAAQDVGSGVRKLWYGRDENRKVRESFGKGGDSKIVNEVEKEVLRLYKETGESSVIPSMIKDKPRKITEKGVSIDFFIHGFSVKELQRLKGDFIRSEVEGLIKTRDYKNVSDSNKIKLLKSVYDNWNRSESINRVSRGKYESIDDFYKHDDNILKFERSLR